MKKFIVFIIMSCLCLLYSCKSSVERKAERQLKETLIELAKNPDTFKINNIETKYSCDSLCVLHCITKGQNGFGGYSSSNIEYLYVIRNDGRIFECVSDLDIEESVLYDYERGVYRDDEHKFLTEDQWLYLRAAGKSFLKGRKVKK